MVTDTGAVGLARISNDAFGHGMEWAKVVVHLDTEVCRLLGEIAHDSLQEEESQLQLGPDTDRMARN